jgi:hypothetical protein
MSSRPGLHSEDLSQDTHTHTHTHTQSMAHFDLIFCMWYEVWIALLFFFLLFELRASRLLGKCSAT